MKKKDKGEAKIIGFSIGDKSGQEKPKGGAREKEKAVRKRKEKIAFNVPEYVYENEEPEAKIGRPTEYSLELAEIICTKIATQSKGIARICEAAGFPHPSTFYRWLAKEENGAFREMYARAKDQQADLLADEVLDIADNNRYDREAFVGLNHIQRDKVRIDARKWKASKLAPQKYGDKLDVTTLGQRVEPVHIYLPDNGRPVVLPNKNDKNGKI